MTGAIVEAERAQIAQVFARLLQFNQATTGLALDDTLVALAATDASGEVIAGIVGGVCVDWLTVHALWVEPEHRGSGLGARLLAAAEQRARDLGAHGVMLDTFDWQAEGFYVKQGYAVFGRLPDCPRGRTRIYLQKVL